MHPIERLRFVARASGAPPGLLVSETAAALASFRHDPQGLVTACRRIVSRQPTSGVLAWLAARVLTGPDPLEELRAATAEVDGDPTGRELAHAIPQDATVCVPGWPDVAEEALARRGDLQVLVVDLGGEGSGLVMGLHRSGVEAEDVRERGLASAVTAADLVLLEASAIGPDEALVPAGARAAAAVAHTADVPVWLVGGVGRLLPARMWDPFVARAIPATLDTWEADDEVLPLSLVDRIAGPWGVLEPDDALRRCDCPVTPELFRGAVF